MHVKRGLPTSVSCGLASAWQPQCTINSAQMPIATNVQSLA